MNWRPRISYLLLFGMPLFLVSSLGITKAQIKQLSFTDKDGQQVIVYSESHALVIWAGEYQPQHWARLANIKSEAEDVSAALIRQGFTITTVSNPTGRQLREKIQEFINNHGYAKRNRLVIYFAGHGFSPYPYRKGYLVPVDAPDPHADPRTEQAFLKVALDMDQIVSWAKQMQAKHVLFVFDSCFSGTIFKLRSASPSPLYIESIMNKPVRQFLTAGDADQEVPAKSFFSPLFIRGIEGEADLSNDGYVTGSELGLYLRQNLGSYTKLQTPQFGTIRDPDLDQGDIIFRSLIMHQVTVISPEFKASKVSRQRTPPSPPKDDFSSQSLSIALSKPDNSNYLTSISTGVDYSPIQKLLFQRDFKKADEITFILMLKAARFQNRDWTERGWLDAKDTSLFPCQDLEIIDSLWSRYSSNKLGLGIQLRIWNEARNSSSTIEEAYREFASRVKWIVPSSSTSGSTYISSADIQYTDPPLGHLPAQLTYPLDDGWAKGGANTYRHLLYSRISDCHRKHK